MRNINLRYVNEAYDEDGVLSSFEVSCPADFNFGYDVVDDIAANDPDRRAMVWCNPEGENHVFTFADMKRWSDKTANFLAEQGVGRGVEARRVGDGHAREQLRLQPVGLEGVELPQYGAQLLRLGGGHRVGEDGQADILRQPGDGLGRDVGVHHQELGIWSSRARPARKAGVTCS